MKGPGISDSAELEEIIPKAVNGDVIALNLLLLHEWLYRLLNRIADWGEHKYHVVHDKDGKDIQYVVVGVIREKITTLKNSRGISWRACLQSWCYSVAGHHCSNHLNRGRLSEDKYRESVKHEHTPYRRGGMDVIAPCSPTVSEEEEIEQEKLDDIRKSQIAQINQTIWRVYYSLTPEQATVVRLWAHDMTLEETASKTGIPRATVHRRLKASHKTFIKELGKLAEELTKTSEKKVDISEVLSGLMERRAGGLRELLAGILPAPA